MSGKQVFRFHIGPVQGFIAQARRTRDLWAGSFLLSWLAAHAMVAVRRQHFEIVFPKVDDDDLIWAIEHEGERAPLLATMPNQFMASGDAELQPAAVTETVERAWGRVATVVYETFVEPLVRGNLGNGTADIWNRQVAGFWEMYWVLGQAEGGGKEGAWLDQRKNWRSWRQPDQGGEHCVLMGEWQEISGHSRIGAASREKHEAFWEAMQQGPAENRREDNRLDLRPGERLCAPALIKRLFPRLPEPALIKAIGWIPGNGVEATRYWPSTGHVAAASWLTDMQKSAAVIDACNALSDGVARLSPRHFSEQHTRIRGVQNTVWFAGNDKHHFGSLDANFLRSDDIANERSLPLYDKHGLPLTGADDKAVRDRLGDLLDAIKTAIDEHNKKATADRDKIKFTEPRPYYAMLLMDGDRVGRLLDGKRDGAVSDALAAFTGKVAQRFGVGCGAAEFDGVLIYAGGDDVLALTTVESAIPAAMKLASDYRTAFHDVTTDEGKTPDISAAIVFADHHEPFRDVSKDTHDLLDHVAKDGNDRASLAIDVRKPSGQAAEWVGKWQVQENGITVEPPALLLQLARERTYSNRFPYNLRARYIAPAMGKLGQLGFDDADLARIFRHEIGKSRDSGQIGEPEVVAMLTLSRPRIVRPEAGLDEAGLLVVRFLDQFGIWS